MKRLIACACLLASAPSFGEETLFKIREPGTVPTPLLEVRGADDPKVLSAIANGITVGRPGRPYATIDLKNGTVTTNGGWDEAAMSFWAAVEATMPVYRLQAESVEFEEPCIFDSETGAEDCPIEQEAILECEPVPCVDSWRDLLVGFMGGLGTALTGVLLSMARRRRRA